MNVIKVKSFPIREVLRDVADAIGGVVKEDCDVFELKIPPVSGSGFIRGVNFSNGLAWLQYDCFFNEDVEIQFTVNDIHPLKIVYNLGSQFKHSFEGQDTNHVAKKFQNLIVASKNKNGHVLRFRKYKTIKINSVEISRKEFVENLICDVNSMNTDLKSAILDTDGTKEHLYDGSCTLKIANVFKSIKQFGYDKFVNKMFLSAKTYEIIALQLSEYSERADLKEKSIQKDFEIITDVKTLLKEDFRKYGSLKLISNKINKSENKIQAVFKQHLDMTGNEFLKEYRMERIVDLLDNSELPIGDIAKLVGIDSSSYLSKIFREKFEVSPLDYRRAKY